MKKVHLLLPFFVMLFAASISVSGQTVFTDDFNRSSFTTGSTGGTPATTYTFNLGSGNIATTLVSGGNYRVDITSGATGGANGKNFMTAPLGGYGSPFNVSLSANNPGLITWTFNMRTNTAVTGIPNQGSMGGGIDLCGDAGTNIYGGSPNGYGVIFNSGSTGGVSLVRFTGGMNTSTPIITQTTTVSKTNFYSVRVTYNASTNQWSLFMRDDGATGFADPSTGVTNQQGSTVTDATYTSQANTLFGFVYTCTAGTGKTMSIDNYTVSLSLPPCSGTPSAGSVVASATAGCGLSYASNLSLTGSTVAAGLTYQWQSSPDNSSWTSVSGATNNTYAATVTADVYYRCQVTCTVSAVTSSNSGEFLDISVPSIATLPFSESFESAWTNGCGIADQPNSQWTNAFVTGNRTWRREDDPQGANTGSWVNPTQGQYSPAFSIGSHSARFHSYQVASGNTGALDLYVNLPSGTNKISYDYINTNGSDALVCQVSVNGGASFTTLDAPPAVASSWTTRTFTTTLSSSTAIVRFLVTSDNGTTDFGLDNITICTQPPGITGTLNVCAGLTTTLANATSGGTWSSSATSIATIGSSTGVAGGVAGGTSTITYLISGGCMATAVLTVNPLPAGITGPSSVCENATITLASTSGGGSWSSSNSSVAGVGSTTGIVTGVSAGTATITYTLSTGCIATALITVNPIPAAISGPNNVCVNSTITLTDVTGAGIWSSSNPGLANIGSASGIVTGAGTGTPAISYTLSTGCFVIKPITVNAVPAPITGGNEVCLSSTLTLANATAGGTWTSGNSTIASIGSGTGIVSGSSVGSTDISYTLSTGCMAVLPFTVNPLPAAISGTTTVCATQVTTLASTPTGGAWSTDNTAIATVAPGSGDVTGVAAGNTVITYTLPTGCIATTAITVNPLSLITGNTGMCLGFTTTLSNATAGGTWSSANSAIASVDPSGVVTGIALGTTDISYSIASTGCTAVIPVIVTNPPSSFALTGGGSYCPGGSGMRIGLSNSNIGITYELYYEGAPTGIILSGNGGALDFGLQTATGNYTVVANPGTSCAITMSGIANVNTYAAPFAYSVTGGGGYCTGGAGVHVGLSGSNTGILYQLFEGSSAIGAAIPGTGTILDFGLITAVGTYTVVATNAITGCTGSMAGGVTVTVNPLPAVYAMTGTNSYCAGGTGIEVGLSNSDMGVNYQLYRGSTPVGSAIAGVGFALNYGYQTVAGSYTTVATNASTGCTSGMSGAAVITVNSLPTIFSVTGGGTYCTGGTGVAIGLGGSSTGVSYQLLYNGVATGSPAAGTGSPLSFGLKTGTGVYTVVATSVSGCTSNMLGSATVATDPLPIVQNVTGGGDYCVGGSGVHIGLSSSVVGTNYFLYNGTTLVGGASGTSASLDFGLFTAAGTYTVSAALPGTGCAAVMNGNATINIRPLPVAYAVTGGGNYCAGGTGFTIGLGNSQPGIAYQLSNGSSLVASFTGTGSSFNFGTYTAAGVYTVFASNTATGCTNAMSGSATISVNPLPTAYAVTGGGSYCSGGTGVHVGISNSDAGATYQLYTGASATGAPVPGTGASIDFGLMTVPGTYTVRAITTVTGCNNVMSGSVIVSTNPLPAIYAVTGGGTGCVGSSSVHIGLSNSDGGIRYQLMRGAAAIGSPLTGTTGATLDFGLQTVPGVYTVIATYMATGCVSSMSGSAAVGVTTPPAVFTVTGGGNYCTGGSGVNVGLGGSSAGISYQLYNGTSPVGAAIAGAGFAFDFGLQTVAGSYTVTATNLSTGCSSNMTGSASVGTNPLPVTFAVTGGGNYCVGGTGVPVGLISSAAGTSYQLQLGGTPIGASMAGTGSTLNFGPQTIAGVYTVSAINTATGCMNNMSGSVPVVINPLPIVYSVMGGGNYCPGGTGVPVGLGSSTIGVNYQLYNGSLMVGPAMAGDGSAIDFGMQTAPGTYTVVATNSLTGCTQHMPGSASVAVSSMPNVYCVTGGGSYCPSGIGVHVGLSNSDAGMNYQLYRNSIVTGPLVSGSGSALDFGLQTSAGTYTVVAVGTGTISCTGNMSGSAMVSVNALPAVHSVTGGGNYCAGGGGLAVGLDGSNAGISYQLYHGGSATGMPMTGTGSDISFGSQTAAGSYTVKATDISTGCNINMTGSAGIAIDPLPNVYAVTGGGHYCIGGMGVTVGLSNSDLGISYQLLNSGTPSGTGAGTTLALDFGLQTATGNYSIVATNPANGCVSNMSGAVNVATDPLPAVFTVSGGGNYCAGGAGVHVMLDGSATGVTYQLITATAPSGTVVAGTGSSLDFGLRTTPGTYTVEATSTATGCVSTMTDAATITASALPIAYTVSGSSAGYCTGGPGVMVSVSGSETGVEYRLYRGGSPASIAVPGTGAPLSMGVHTSAGVYTVVAANAVTGCTNNMSGAASVSINPLPLVFTVTGGGSYCNGDAGVHIGLSGSVTGTSYQLYRASIAVGGALAGTGSPLDFGFQATAGNYTVVATNITTGCVSTMTGSATVVVNTLPGLYAVTGGGSYCDGGTGVVAGLSGSAAGIMYQLHHDGTAIGVPMAGTAGPLNFGMQTAAGTYTIVAVNSTTGCTRTMAGSAVVSINTSPVVYTVTGGGNYCAGGTGVHVGIGGSNTGISYQLYRGSTMVGVAVTGTGSSMDFGLQTVAGNYTITATTGITGCRRAMAGSATVVVNSQPVVYTVTGGGNYCAGGAGVHVGLNNSASGVDYTLYNTGGPVTTVTGTGTALDFGLLPAGSYTAIAEHTASGCTQNMSGSAVVTATPTATPSVTLYTGMGDSVCAGRLVTFVATTANGGLAPMYEWTINGIALSTTADNYSYLPVNGDVVQVKLTSNANCASPAVVYNTMTMTVSTPEMPSVLIASDRGNEVCQGQSVTYSAAATYGGSLPRYTWKKNGATVGTSPTYSYIPVNGDDVYCIVHSNYHCRLSDSAISNHVNMTVAVPVVPAVTISANPGLSIAPGVTEVLTATVTNSITAPTYQWLVNGTAIPGAIGQSYSNNTYANLDQVTCKVRSGGVCSGTEGSASVTITIWAAGVNGVGSAFTDIRLVPNPNKGTFMVKGMLGAQGAQDVSVEITNMLGQVVYSSSIQSRNGEVNEQIQLSNALANGMYMLNLRSGTESKVFHMVIEH